MSETKRGALSIQMRGQPGDVDTSITITANGDTFSAIEWITILLFIAGQVLDQSGVASMRTQNDKHRLIIEKAEVMMSNKTSAN